MVGNILWLVEKVVQRSGARYEIIDYPKKGKKSVDLLVTKGKERFVVRVVDDYTKVTRAEADELKKLAATFSCKPAVVSENEDLDEEIPIDKGVPLVRPKTLERRLSGEKFFTIYSKGEIYVKIESEIISRKRAEMDMSLGEVASKLGVTRMSVYEYERGITNKVTINIARKLVDLFGEEVLGDVFEVSKNEVKPSGELRHRESKELSVKGYAVFEYSYTPIDITAFRNDEVVAVVVTEDDSKIENAKKIVRMFGGEFYIKST
ncbi:MAG: helix-turn-helix domain-containing protein [Thermoprotei archaeon]